MLSYGYQPILVKTDKPRGFRPAGTPFISSSLVFFAKPCTSISCKPNRRPCTYAENNG